MQYQYVGAYNANAAYMVPMGVPPIIAQKMMAASNAFRFFDKDHTGFLNKEGEYNNKIYNTFIFQYYNIYINKSKFYK